MDEFDENDRPTYIDGKPVYYGYDGKIEYIGDDAVNYGYDGKIEYIGGKSVYRGPYGDRKITLGDLE